MAHRHGWAGSRFARRARAAALGLALACGALALSVPRGALAQADYDAQIRTMSDASLPLEARVLAADALAAYALAPHRAIDAAAAIVADPAAQVPLRLAAERILRNTGLSSSRDAVVRALRQSLGDAGAPRGLRVLAACALQPLGALDDPPRDFTGVVLDALGDGPNADDEQRWCAVQLAGAVPDGDPRRAEVTRALFALLGPPARRSALRRAAAQALAEQRSMTASLAFAPLLEVMARDEDAIVRGALAPVVAWRVGPGRPERSGDADARRGTQALLDALRDPQQDDSVRQAAASALDEVGKDLGPAQHLVPPALLGLVADAARPDKLRETAAEALSSVPLTSGQALELLALLPRTADDPRVFTQCIKALHSAPDTPVPAIHYLVQRAGGPDPDVAAAAAEALGSVEQASIARNTWTSVLEALRATLHRHPDDEAGKRASESLAKLAQYLARRNATGLLDELKAVQRDPALRGDARAAVTASVKDLSGAWRRSLQNAAGSALAALGRKPWATGPIAVLVLLALGTLALFWLRPLALLRWAQALERAAVAVPVPLGFAKLTVPLQYVLLAGFLRHHPRVLDAWVRRHLADARKTFGKLAVVREHDAYVEVAVDVEGQTVDLPSPATFRPAFQDAKTVLLLCGEGGSGKTSLALQIARWVCSEDPHSWLRNGRPMLPVLVEDDVPYVAKDPVPALVEIVAGKLAVLVGAPGPLPPEFVEALLRRGRLLLIVDGLSELGPATQKLIAPSENGFPANALVVTSRRAELLAGAPVRVVKTRMIQRATLSRFLELYLDRLGALDLFTGPEFFEHCARLTRMTGDRDTTVLFATLFAKLMLATKQPGATTELPTNVPELMVQYVGELTKSAADGDACRAAMVVAWECVRVNFRPGVAHRKAACDALGGGARADQQLDDLTSIGLLRPVSAAPNHLRFALDPLAEYLAALEVVNRNGGDAARWQELLARLDAAHDGDDFRLALRECYESMRAPLELPPFVFARLAAAVASVTSAPPPGPPS